MTKVYLCVGFSILFSIFYIFSFLFYQNEKNREAVPKITNEAVNLLSVNDFKEKKQLVLPDPGKVKELYIKNDDYDRKTKPTPLTFKKDQKTVSPRLSKEEIQQAKIAKIIPMRVNGENMEMVIVEKDGLYYDASDGVMVFMPEDFEKIFRKYNMIKY